MMQYLWISDPKTKEKSVSLTLLVATFVGCCVGATLQMMGKIENVSIFLELFYGSSALYFGRKFQVKGQSYEATASDKDSK